MTKHEFLLRLTDALVKRGVPEAEDIISEYEAHFAFKLADGYAEEVIAARLGDPASLAAQFAQGASEKPFRGSKALTAVGLGFLDLFAGMAYILLWAFEIVKVAFALACAAIAVCLFGELNIQGWIPPMPYWCGAVFGLSLAALSAFTAAECVSFAAFTVQIARAYKRFHENAMRNAAGKPRLPALSVAPQLSPRTNRRLRAVSLTSLVVFAVSLLLGIGVSMISARALEFWHAWNWFM